MEPKIGEGVLEKGVTAPTIAKKQTHENKSVEDTV